MQAPDVRHCEYCARFGRLPGARLWTVPGEPEMGAKPVVLGHRLCQPPLARGLVEDDAMSAPSTAETAK